jgi:hypothetical protein
MTQSPGQAGSCSGFSTTDHLQAINRVMEMQKTSIKRLTWLSLSTKKAFDSVEQKFVLLALKNPGAQDTYI